MKQSVTFSSSIKQWNKVDFINIALITFTWSIMTIVVNPLGDFPLNDDWAYAESVKHLLETGNFQLPGWAVANLLPQVLWGALFCLPLGFSFTALRFSTLTLGLIGVIATYKLFQEIIIDRKLAFIGAFILAVNPLYFGLANTFMTDVPHYAVTILSLYFFCSGIKQNSRRAIIAAVFWAIISLLIRQVTAALFLGYAIAYIVKNKARISSVIIAAILFICLPIGIQSIFSDVFWPKTFGDYGAKEQEFVSQISYIDIKTIINFLYFTLSAFLYLGGFLFPVLAIAYIIKYNRIKSQSGKILLTSSLLFLITTIGIWTFSTNRRMPIAGNVINDWGLGPLTLRDTFLSQSESIPNYLDFFWLIVTVIAIIGAALLLIFTCFSAFQLFLDRQISLERKSLILLNNSTAFIYFLPLGLSFFFDRYLLLLLPLSIVMVLNSLDNVNSFKLSFKKWFLTGLTILFISVLTVAVTHDYLSWNRVRWQALENLMQQQITPDRIDGGFEFNGWYLYDPDYPVYQKRKNNEVWWWSEKNDYIIAFSPIKGYTAIEQYSLQNWLPFPSDRILVLQKK
jgi:hypothetical protein